MSIADRMAILDNGRIRQVGAPAELYDTPGQRLCRAPARLADDQYPAGPGQHRRRPGGGRGSAARAGSEGRRACRRDRRAAGGSQASSPGARGNPRFRPGCSRSSRSAAIPSSRWTAAHARLRAMLRGQPGIRPDALVSAVLRARARPLFRCRRQHAAAIQGCADMTGGREMADGPQFEPDVKVRTKSLQDRLHRRRHDHGRVPSRRLQGGGISGRGDRLAHQGAMPRRSPSAGASPRSTTTPEALIDDPSIEILDIAFPPDQQPELIRQALKQNHIKAILAQKPLALSLSEAIKLRDEAAAAGKILSVNQNMRYDQSMRVLKQIIDSGALGDIVFAADRHARDPALADISGGLRPADAVQHERAPSRRAAFPVRRPGRDHHADPQGPAHDASTTPTASPSRRCASRRACWQCRWRTSGRARARRATRTTSTSTGASTGRTASPRARSAGRRARPRR